MPLVLAKCTNCGANLKVDSAKDAAVCQFCGSAFIVEKAIHNYTIHNDIRADVVNIYGQQSNESDQRRNALQTIEKLYTYFSQKAEEYNELDSVNAELIRRAGGPSVAILGWGIGISLLAVLFLVLIGKVNPWVGIIPLLVGVQLIGLYVFIAIYNKQRMKELRKREFDLLDIIHAHYMKCPDCPFGEEYSHPKDIQDLYDVIRQGRATTIKEAINLVFQS